MAKEAGKPKVKKRGKGGKGQGRPKFCPNSSKSFNLSTTRSNSRLHASTTALKKNNEELAKNLNFAKEVIAKLQKENGAKDAESMELRMELGQLRAGPDPNQIEMEIQRRVKEHMVKLNKDIRAAMDHTIGLSGILTELCVSTNRASVTSAGSGVGMMVSARSSDIGGTRMRQVAGTSTNTWSRGSQGSGTSPPRQLSTVRPMVAGHAISRPRIQLERVDLASMAQVNDQQPEELTEDPVTEDIEEEQEEVPPSPQAAPMSRNVFDLTNIREESTLMDDSVMNAMEETVISPNMEAVQEENLEDISHEEEAISRRLTSTVARTSLRQSLRPPVNMDSSLSPTPGPSQSPISQLPDTSPYILETDTTPVGLPRRVSMPRPDSSAPSPRQNESASFSESFFLEQMAMDGEDPLEGPSWLFASIKKKKRKSSAVRKLSCILSDMDSTAGTSSIDNSELELLETSSANASGMVLDKDLRQSGPQDDQENVPLDDGERTILNPGSRVSVAASPRTPLTSLKTRLEDGVNIKEARIMLSNVGVTPETTDSPSVGKNKDLTLDQLFSFGIRSDSDESSLLKRKFGSLEQEGSSVSQPTVMLKKARTTDIAAASRMEVRLENVSQPPEPEIEKPAEGRSRRQRAGQVSYKEVSVRQKMRQGDAGSSSIYGGFIPQEKEEKKKKKVAKKK